jgi:hypothetical protein
MIFSACQSNQRNSDSRALAKRQLSEFIFVSSAFLHVDSRTSRQLHSEFSIMKLLSANANQSYQAFVA